MGRGLHYHQLVKFIFLALIKGASVANIFAGVDSLTDVVASLGGRTTGSRKLIEAIRMPLGLKHQSKDEASYLKFHKCRDEGEVYSASYLASREHILKQFSNFSLATVK
jgi:hypothetical protein